MLFLISRSPSFYVKTIIKNIRNYRLLVYGMEFTIDLRTTGLRSEEVVSGGWRERQLARGPGCQGEEAKPRPGPQAQSRSCTRGRPSAHGWTRQLRCCILLNGILLSCLLFERVSLKRGKPASHRPSPGPPAGPWLTPVHVAIASVPRSSRRASCAVHCAGR